jgi:hypothetical protein
MTPGEIPGEPVDPLERFKPLVVEFQDAVLLDFRIAEAIALAAGKVLQGRARAAATNAPKLGRPKKMN